MFLEQFAAIVLVSLLKLQLQLHFLQSIASQYSQTQYFLYEK